MSKFILGFIVLFTTIITSTASAHTGMEHSSVQHNSSHLIITASVFLAIIAAGFYLYRSLPKAKRIRIKK